MVRPTVRIAALLYFCSAIFSVAAQTDTASLYSYSGYVATPSAYITDGRLGLHYTYLPNPVGPFHKGHSENRVFSGTIGFLPFVEGYVSVYAAPRIDISKTIYSYGSDKTRSMGIKVRVLNERKWTPAVAVGIFDPDLEDAGVDLSANSISSLFWVLSKGCNYGSLSLGYGYREMSGRYVRLEGLFGGMSVSLVKNVNFLTDYDGEFWSTGLNARWKGIDFLAASVYGHGPAYRIGYHWYLLD